MRGQSHNHHHYQTSLQDRSSTLRLFRTSVDWDAKFSHHAAKFSPYATIITPRTYWDNFAIIFLLLQLSPDNLIFIYLIFSIFTIQPVFKGFRGFTVLPSPDDCLHGQAAYPSHTTILYSDTLALAIWILLWTPVHNIGLDSALAIVAISMSGVNGKSSSNGGIIKRFIMCILLTIFFHYSKDNIATENLAKTLVGNETRIDKANLQIYLPQTFFHGRGWIQNVLGVHILTQAIVISVRRALFNRKKKQQSSSVIKPNRSENTLSLSYLLPDKIRGKDDRSSDEIEKVYDESKMKHEFECWMLSNLRKNNKRQTETCTTTTRLTSDTEFGNNESIAKMKDRKLEMSSNKVRKLLGEQTRSNQPLWCAIAWMKICVLNSHNCRIGFSSARNNEYGDNTGGKTYTVDISSTYVKLRVIDENNSHKDNQDKFSIKLNGYNWDCIKINQIGNSNYENIKTKKVDRQSTLITIDGLCEKTKYKIEVIRQPDGKVIDVITLSSKIQSEMLSHRKQTIPVKRVSTAERLKKTIEATRLRLREIETSGAKKRRENERTLSNLKKEVEQLTTKVEGRKGEGAYLRGKIEELKQKGLEEKESTKEFEKEITKLQGIIRVKKEIVETIRGRCELDKV